MTPVTRSRTKVRAHLEQIFQAAKQAVKGEAVVSSTFRSGSFPPRMHVVAIGKAAESMFVGVPQDRVLSALLISKKGHFSTHLKWQDTVTCVEADHPLPGEASLRAGKRLTRFLEGLPPGEPLLFLISGGTSALVEVLPAGWNLAALRELTGYLLSNAYPIDEINRIRRRLSLIKGGGLWEFIGKRHVDCLMISDVPGDDPAIIGSGLLYPDNKTVLAKQFPRLPNHWTNRLSKVTGSRRAPEQFTGHVIATLEDAKQAAAKMACKLGYSVDLHEEFLDGEAEVAANYCVNRLFERPATIAIWGGETTVCLPGNPGQGGRNQHLALAAVLAMDKHGGRKPATGLTVLLAAGTDGSDGETTACGAIVDESTRDRGKKSGLDARRYLQRADSHTFLSATDDLLPGGATGTNVMDLVIGCHIPKGLKISHLD